MEKCVQPNHISGIKFAELAELYGDFPAQRRPIGNNREVFQVPQLKGCELKKDHIE